MYFLSITARLRCTFFLLLAGLAAASLPAQFTGGDGDGHVRSLVVQLHLDGIPDGVQALYLGGSGDGFDHRLLQTTPDGANVAVLFGGGPGDGFDEATGALTLSGQSLVVLYGGGDGDGFDRETAALTLSGQSLAALYGGGDGDGFDQDAVALTLGGESLALLYGGGDGDGFAANRKMLVLNGAMLAALYGGGDGDGFDQLVVAATVSGTNLAQLYGGGRGDGFDVALFAGSVPLPLTLISFEALPREKFVLLRWVTEDEQATDFFTIEKTRTGAEFADVGDVTAAGFAEPGERIHYELEDGEPYAGTSFYRLKTTDLDGAISLSHLVEVEYVGADNWSFVLFPNPSTGRHLNVRPQGVEPGTEVTAHVMDATGRQLFSETWCHDGNALPIELATRLTAGSYLVRVGNKQIGFRAKILIVGGR